MSFPLFFPATPRLKKFASTLLPESFSPAARHRCTTRTLQSRIRASLGSVSPCSESATDCNSWCMFWAGKFAPLSIANTVTLKLRFLLTRNFSTAFLATWKYGCRTETRRWNCRPASSYLRSPRAQWPQFKTQAGNYSRCSSIPKFVTPS